MSSTNTHNGQNHHHHGQFITLLHNLGSKEVECHVQLTVHSVSDLPVKSGQFRVRWKFRDIDAKLAKQHRKAAAALKAKEHQATPSQAASQPESQATSTTASSSDTEDRDKPANEHTPSDTSRKQPRPRPANESTNAVVYSSEERGQTDYARMRKRDHTVMYEHTVDVIARMRVYKGELNSEPLKLVVEQVRAYPRVIIYTRLTVYSCPVKSIRNLIEAPHCAPVIVTSIWRNLSMRAGSGGNTSSKTARRMQ